MDSASVPFHIVCAHEILAPAVCLTVAALNCSDPLLGVELHVGCLDHVSAMDYFESGWTDRPVHDLDPSECHAGWWTNGLCDGGWKTTAQQIQTGQFAWSPGPCASPSSRHQHRTCRMFRNRPTAPVLRTDPPLLPVAHDRIDLHSAMEGT